jgi:hypothetical protein
MKPKHSGGWLYLLALAIVALACCVMLAVPELVQ